MDMPVVLHMRVSVCFGTELYRQKLLRPCVVSSARAS